MECFFYLGNVMISRDVPEYQYNIINSHRKYIQIPKLARKLGHISLLINAFYPYLEMKSGKSFWYMLITILKFYIPKNKLSDYGYNDFQLENKIYLLILLYTKGKTESGLFFWD